MTEDTDTSAESPEDARGPVDGGGPAGPDEVGEPSEATSEGEIPAEERFEEERRRLVARADEADRKATEIREQLLRTAADFDNYRKRLDRERIDERKQAAASLVRQLLPVADSLRRAMDQAGGGSSGGIEGFVDGLRLIESQFFDILRSAGLQVIDAKGQAFDPSLHEALLQEASTEPHMTVLDVLETGYLFNGRLLRPARVKVAFNPESREAEVAERSDDAGGIDDAS